MTASQDSSKVQWLLAKGLAPTSDATAPGELSRKLKLRIVVASVVAFCVALGLLGALMSFVNH